MLKIITVLITILALIKIFALILDTNQKPLPTSYETLISSLDPTKEEANEPLSLYIDTNYILTNNTIPIVAKGGVKPYVLKVNTGSLHSLTTNKDKIFYKAPATPQTVTLHLIDSTGQDVSKTLTIITPLITQNKTISLNTKKSYSLFPSGGKKPYSYKVVFGESTVTNDGLVTASNLQSSSRIEISDALSQVTYVDILVAAKPTKLKTEEVKTITPNTPATSPQPTENTPPPVQKTEPTVETQKPQYVPNPPVETQTLYIPGESTAPTQTPEKIQEVTPKSNRLIEAFSDMKQDNEALPYGVGLNNGWAHRPQIVMNTEPYGTSLPSWYPGTRFPEWRAFLPWFVIYQASTGNPATNSEVEINGIELWVLLKSTKTWVKINTSQKPYWHSTYALDTLGSGSKIDGTPTDSQGLAFSPTDTYMVHGGLAKSPVPWTENGGDIYALYVSTRHRLVLKNKDGVDDRSVANLIVETGLDYYPTLTLSPKDLNSPYVPPAGNGRFLKATTNWRYSSLLLINKNATEAEILNIQPPAFDY